MTSIDELLARDNMTFSEPAAGDSATVTSVAMCFANLTGCSQFDAIFPPIKADLLFNYSLMSVPLCQHSLTNDKRSNNNCRQRDEDNTCGQHPARVQCHWYSKNDRQDDSDCPIVS